MKPIQTSRIVMAGAFTAAVIALCCLGPLLWLAIQ
jgi:hypothetical protein